MFHWQDGWFFRRNDDGSVHVIKRETSHSVEMGSPYDAALITEANIPAAEWASIVCSVSKDGETGERWSQFQDFHGRPGAG